MLRHRIGNYSNWGRRACIILSNGFSARHSWSLFSPSYAPFWKAEKVTSYIYSSALVHEWTTKDKIMLTSLNEKVKVISILPFFVKSIISREGERQNVRPKINSLIDQSVMCRLIHRSLINDFCRRCYNEDPNVLYREAHWLYLHNEPGLSDHCHQSISSNPRWPSRFLHWPWSHCTIQQEALE